MAHSIAKVKAIPNNNHTTSQIAHSIATCKSFGLIILLTRPNTLPKVQYFFGYFQSHLGCLLLVTTLSRLTGRNSTVPPKSIPNVTSLEPLICPWEVLLLQNRHILPKRNISLPGPQHPPKVKYFLNTDTTELQGGRHDGDPHTTRYDP